MTKTEFAEEFQSLRQDHESLMELYEKETGLRVYGCAMEDEVQDCINMYHEAVVSLVELYLHD